MEINNAEQQILFEKLDEMKKEIERGVYNTYSSSIFHGNFEEVYETFFDDEKKRPHKYFMYDYGSNNGRFCEYTEEGPEKQIMTYDSDGRLYIEDFKDGLIYEEVSYKNSQLHGYVLQRHQNGNIKEEGYYKNGLRDQYGYQGLECVDYREDGTLIRKAQYTDGQLDGTCTDYHENGKVKEVACYILGQKDGLCEYYDLDGHITQEFYMDGQKMENVPTDQELLSAVDSLSFDELLSSFESRQDLSNSLNEQPKGLSKTLSTLSWENKNSSINTIEQKEEASQQSDKTSVPLAPRRGQIIQPPLPPKVPTQNDVPLPPQVFLHGKGGR